ncbi:DUF433 domain-containing protein [Gloeothece verrucosa]|uniref:Putative antitoxin VapB45-like DNA-binding HTH domain-containing protein n=1 Tax=Gloeothece verrucosa (strain PCC 7822) TaxID=497965 RepID=E0UAX8_GLOV7|nr:DUF433 domain-containing protein [Gloeothece verrucosa]ADN15100.1 protein of unknown function DUF433 [Gloeothece verrucosa PCC 7822]
MNDLYGGKDPRDMPNYSIGDAARYLRIPQATIRSWTVGRYYPTTEGSKFFQPLISIPKNKPRLLSFTNLIEVHVLRAIRTEHEILLDKVRSALDFIDEQFKIPHPLAQERFRTDGVDLFIEKYGSLINASTKEMIELEKSLDTHLKRIETDEKGLGIKLYPFTRSPEEDNPRILVFDPRIAFGRLVIDGTGIPTSNLAERYRAGDSIEDLAYDYDCDSRSIKEAIDYELQLPAAA